MRDHGFELSPYPLILSLERHFSDDSAGRIGQIFDRVLGYAALQQRAGVPRQVGLCGLNQDATRGQRRGPHDLGE